MKNIIQCLFTITVLVTSTQAYAGSTTIVVKDGNSVSQSYDVTTDGAGTAGNFLARSVICDQATGSTCATVSGGALQVGGTITSIGSVTVTNTNANGQATMANSSPAVLPSNQQMADPCVFQAKTNVPVSVTTSASVQLVALSGSTKIYVCSARANRRYGYRILNHGRNRNGLCNVCRCHYGRGYSN